MSKQSLATKFRPKHFSDVVEQNAVKKILQNQLKNNSFQNAYLFCGPAGDGKALTMETPILTPNGYVLNKDIKVNDKVISGEGTVTTVIGVYPQGVKAIYEITFNDNTKCQCSIDHLWKVKYKEDWEVLDTKKIISKYSKYKIYIPTAIILDFKTNAITPPMDIDLSQGVPDVYKYGSLGIRMNVLNIIKTQYGFKQVHDNGFINIKSKKLSEDLTFILQTLGGVDIVTYMEGNEAYEHCFRLPKNDVKRFIVDIKYIGDKECQCIKVDSQDHTFMINDCIITHNTTTARIFANELNEHKGNIIELDAASHNGIDDIRNIIQQAQTQSITGKYKVFLLDECFTPDVEILTESGFVKFNKLNNKDKVAQWEDGKITFVRPEKYIVKDYEGVVYNVNGVKMTPNHIIPLKYKDGIKEEYIKDAKFTRYKSILISGKSTEGKEKMGTWAKFSVVCQNATLYGTDSKYNKYCISKSDILLSMLKELKIEHNLKDNLVFFNLPSAISIKQYLDLNYTAEAAREIISFTKQLNPDFKFRSNSNLLQYYIALSFIAGYQVACKEENDYTSITLSEKETINCRYLKKVEEEYKGKVYCVTVPSHKIIVKSKDFIMVNGNCHALSNNAWQALLKIIEEPPAKTMFLMCTTDPQKIPSTILSRVQRYDFKRVSYKGICERLKYILQQENYGDIDEETEKSVSYIAKLADGGMRDAITHLDKCLSYGRLNLKNTVRILGTTNYDVMIKLTDYILNKDKANIIETIESIYNVGRDIKTFVKQYITFLLDVEKYNILENFLYIQIPETDEYKEWLSKKHNVNVVLNSIIELSNNIAYSAYPKADLEIAILKNI